jgi:hypothetical protein
VYKSIAIIGLGSVGGFLAKNISEMESVEKLILIDYDVVEPSNLKKSIYKKSQVGKLKTECISTIIQKFNNEIEIISINEKYIEGKTKIPKCDLVIDCRDFVYDRKSEIDIRLCISGTYLIIDATRNIKYKLHYEGKYIDNLSKNDINIGTFNFATLISNSPESIKKIIKKQLIYTIKLDFIKKFTAEALSKYENKPDMILDSYKDEMIINLLEHSEEIISNNKNKSVKLCFESAIDPWLSKKIPKNSIKNENMIAEYAFEMIKSVARYNHYIIQPEVINNEYYIVLIPQTGAA